MTNLPQELEREINRTIILLSQVSQPSDIALIVKRFTKAAILIVAKIDAEIAHEIEQREAELAQQKSRPALTRSEDVERSIGAYNVRQAILSRWKMED